MGVFKRFVSILKFLLSLISKPFRKIMHLDPDNEEIKRYEEFLKGLDEQQKLAVVSRAKHILVIAGAGAGKTRVLIKRIIHLIKNKNVSASSILAITFTNNAANEIKKRVYQEIPDPNVSNNLTVKTFHGFCSHLLRAYGYKPNILPSNSDKQKNFIQDIISDFKHEYMYLFYNYIINYMLKDKKEVMREGFEKIIEEPIRVYYYKTKRGEWVRSKSERDIANFLCDLGLRYEYEPEAAWGDAPFKPDFYIGDADLYIEHWGFNQNPSYLKVKAWKKEQFRKHRKHLVETNEFEMRDMDSVFKRLAIELEEHIALKDKLKRIYEVIHTIPNYKAYLDMIEDDVLNAINLAKNYEVFPDDLRKRIDEYAKNERDFPVGQMLDFYSFALPIYYEYQMRLKGKGLTDYNDLFLNAICLLKGRKDIRDELSRTFSHILVDEYQDVSRAEVELLSLLAGETNNIFAVGDDWQSIYGFRGSEPKFFLDFEKDFANPKKIFLTNNYRNGKYILKAGEAVIALNKGQMGKELASKANYHEKIHVYRCNDGNDCVHFLANSIKKLANEGYKKEKMLLLYRRLPNISNISSKLNMKSSKTIMTIHKAKGMDADVVYILGVKGGEFGFPAVWGEEMIFKVIRDIDLDERMEEERRCMYVAMTRARKKLIIITDKFNESDFIKQLPYECLAECGISYVDELIDKLNSGNIEQQKEAAEKIANVKLSETDRKYVCDKLLRYVSKKHKLRKEFLDCIEKIGSEREFKKLEKLLEKGLRFCLKS
ncbi:UvrD-helicase domain-containing protein [Candidatus Woesearchaeota archaeon]|nr:UvrD-helicase domain-containing protein [Candidatus Woesearchaeota archaeon]